MFKNLKQNIVFLFMIFIIPLTIESVNCSWVYYEGNVIDNSTNISGLILGKFNFLPYPNEYPNTPEGKENNDIFDQLVGTQPLPEEGKDGWVLPETNDKISLTDPNSPINKALSTKNLGGVISKDKPYITSKDYFDTNGDKEITRADKNANEYFYGKDADPNNSFVIVRETFGIDGVAQQIYSIYTTTVDLNKLNKGDLIYHVYKTTIVWTRNSFGQDLAQGKYSVSTTGNVQGTCTVTENETTIINNKGKEVTLKGKFFDYGSFKQTN